MKSLCLLLLCAAASLATQDAAVAVPDSWRHAATLKVENGATIIWRRNSASVDEPQIHMHSKGNEHGFALNVVSHLPDAVSVSVADVSMGRSGRFAVGAVAVGADRRPSALLLLFSPGGSLLHKLALHSNREISRLVVDDDDSVWTLCGDGNGKLLAHYSPAGIEVGAFLARSEIPEAGDSVDGNLLHGATSFGLTGSRVWFWLPSTRTLVSVNRDGSMLAREPVSQLARPATVSAAARPELLGAVQLGNGAHAIQIVWVSETRREIVGYTRGPATNAWTLDSRGTQGRLLGTDGQKLAFLHSEGAQLAVHWQ